MIKRRGLDDQNTAAVPLHDGLDRSWHENVPSPLDERMAQVYEWEVKEPRGREVRKW